jgi:uncharacterized damage-inducible protein DinB
MKEEFIRHWLVSKFEEIERRIILVIDQLSDDQLNWHPNNSSNSISTLVVHISGNINERVGKGINNKPYERDREKEFEQTYLSKSELKEMLEKNFQELIETTRSISAETLAETQIVRNRERTNLDILLQCAAHFSEHMGQILYLGKLCLDDRYETTSIPRRI